MPNRLVVATTCPTCGAPLDFTEGTHAIQCPYCQATLLITGRKQVLSYAISPKIAVQRAVARVMLAHREQELTCRIIKPQLYFLPYYRFTGHDLRWNGAPPGATALDTLPLALQSAVLTHTNATVAQTPHLQFHDRYVEKNFLACHLPGLGLHSLGVRPAVLRLELCDRERLEHLGTLVPVDITPKMALSQGLQTPSRPWLVTRQVLGRVLSVIYFPYWIVEVERQDHTMLSLVDAVCGKVLQIAAPCHLYTILHRQRTTASRVVQFRPLVCPNCGWDLPCRSEDIIFFCTACDQAWQMVGSDLRAIAYQVVDRAPGAKGHAVTYLPFWCLQAHASLPGVNTYWMPAFRYRRLKRLVDLAARLTLHQPPYKVMTGPKPALHGCFYDAHDAIRLAQFTHVGLMRKSPQNLNLAPPLAFARGRLTWVPFRHQGRDLVDPWTNFPLPRHLLV